MQQASLRAVLIRDALVLDINTLAFNYKIGAVCRVLSCDIFFAYKERSRCINLDLVLSSDADFDVLKVGEKDSHTHAVQHVFDLGISCLPL